MTDAERVAAVRQGLERLRFKDASKDVRAFVKRVTTEGFSACKQFEIALGDYESFPSPPRMSDCDRALDRVILFGRLIGLKLQ